MVIRSPEPVAPEKPPAPAAGEPTRPDIIDKAYILSVNPFSIFATGLAKDTELKINSRTGKKWRWIAVKGGGPDWVIYCSPDHWTEEHIKGLGDKVCDPCVIRLLVKCDDSAMEIYRQ